MHKIGKCEERGSGYDKVIDSTSKNSLIAPRIENQDDQFTKVVLFSKMPFDITTKEDRIRTCYMLSCLYYVNFNAIGNADIRSIFGLTEKESYKASRILKETMEAGLIKPNDITAPRYTKYLPSWV